MKGSSYESNRMTVYMDVPRWERHHGLSGHLIGDSLEELDAFAGQLGLDLKDRMFFARCPHYQLPATRVEDAMVAGAVLLEQNDFMRRVNCIVAKLDRQGRCTSSSDMAACGQRRRKKIVSGNTEKPASARIIQPKQDVLFDWTPPD